MTRRVPNSAADGFSLIETTIALLLLAIVAAGGAPTLKEQRTEKEQARRSSLEADPMVAAVLAHFPGAQIVAVRGRDDGVATSGDAAPTEGEVWDDASSIEED